MESSEEARKLVRGAPGRSACRVGGRGLPYPSRACPPRAVRPPAVPSAGLAPPWLGLGLGLGLRLGIGLGLRFYLRRVPKVGAIVVWPKRHVRVGGVGSRGRLGSGAGEASHGAVLSASADARLQVRTGTSHANLNPNPNPKPSAKP